MSKICIEGAGQRKYIRFKIKQEYSNDRICIYGIPLMFSMLPMIVLLKVAYSPRKLMDYFDVNGNNTLEDIPELNLRFFFHPSVCVLFCLLPSLFPSNVHEPVKEKELCRLKNPP